MNSVLRSSCGVRIHLVGSYPDFAMETILLGSDCPEKIPGRIDDGPISGNEGGGLGNRSSTRIKGVDAAVVVEKLACTGNGQIVRAWDPLQGIAASSRVERRAGDRGQRAGRLVDAVGVDDGGLLGVHFI